MGDEKVVHACLGEAYRLRGDRGDEENVRRPPSHNIVSTIREDLGIAQRGSGQGFERWQHPPFAALDRFCGRERHWQPSTSARRYKIRALLPPILCLMCCLHLISRHSDQSKWGRYNMARCKSCSTSTCRKKWLGLWSFVASDGCPPR